MINLALNLMALEKAVKKNPNAIDPHIVYKTLVSFVSLLNKFRTTKLSVPIQVVDLIAKKDYKGIVSLCGPIPVEYNSLLHFVNRLGFDLIDQSHISNAIETINQIFSSEHELLKGV